MTPIRPVLAVTGLLAEARIAAGAGVTTVSGGGDAAGLALLLQAALAKGAKAVISFGIAGGLQPGLTPGTTVIGRVVDDGETRVTADAAWVQRLAAALPQAVVGGIAGIDHAVCAVERKHALHRQTGAVAVDMESHVAARLAALHGVPFVALRIVADPAERTVPHAATVGMRADGSTDVGAVLRALARKPGELPALLRTAFDAKAALGALLRNRQSLSSLFGFNEPRFELPRDGLFGRPLMVDIDGFPGLGGAGVELPVESS